MKKKKCPFCGNIKSLVLQLDGGLGYTTGYRIVCLCCGAEGPHIKIKVTTDFDPDLEATEAWNKRT